MKKFPYIIIFSIISLCTISAQEGKIKIADKSYDNLGYLNANEIYKDVAEAGYGNAKIYERIGNSYFFNAKYEQASRWYTKLVNTDTNKELKPIIALRYSQSLQAIGDNLEAQKWYNYFKNRSPFFKDIKIIPIEMPSDSFKINNLKINSDEIEFGPFLFKNKLFYTSSKITSKFSYNPVDPWTGLGYLNIFEAKMNGNVSSSKGYKIRGDINSNFHESSSCLTKDGKTIYFTRNSSNLEEGSKRRQHLKIYRATLKNGKWRNIEDLEINGDNFSTAHPTLNETEDKLYFSSDRPGSFGETDIYVARIENNGSLTKVQNLGSKINTPGRESFPFVSKYNELFFSSDGYMGNGGYDIYYAKIKDSTKYSRIVHLPYPLNSERDDFSLFSVDSMSGFFSSNRPQGKGRDDIYSYSTNIQIHSFLKNKVVGRVFDSETRKNINNALIKVYQNNKELLTLKSNRKGEFEFESEFDEDYRIIASATGYNIEDSYIIANKEVNQLDFVLSKNIFEIKEGLDLTEVLNIQNIHFEYGKSKISKTSEVELQKVVSALKLNPTLRIEIKSYADSRGTDEFNLKLSKMRAKATVNYIIRNGISISRVKGSGFGEKFLLNDCGDGKNCDENEHQKNRRSEFLIYKINKD